MWRLLALALLLLAPAMAPAQSPRIDVTTRGIAPGNTAAANSDALDALLDSIARPTEVYFPSDLRTYTFRRPINPDRGGLRFASDGLGATLALAGRTDPLFLFGYGKKPGGKALTPDHVVDLFGRLDASAAPAPGRRWAYRTRGDSWLAQGAGPFALGPMPGRWASVRRLTVEIALDTTEAGAPNGPIVDLAGVLSMWVDPANGRWNLWLYGPESAPGVRPTHKATWLVPKAPGVHRVAVQVDLDAPHATAYVDGGQVAVTEYWAPGGRPATLLADDGRTYLIGASGGTALGTNPWPGNPRPDLSVLGHALYSALRYADAGPGTPQRRLDGGTLNDASRYLIESDPDLIALLRLQDRPEDAGNRLVTVIAGPALDRMSAGRGSSMLALSYEHSRLGMGPFALRNLTVRGGGNDVYGPAVLIGGAGDCEFTDCDLRGGARGIDNWGSGANYLHRARRCTLAGTDAALFSYNALWDLEDIKTPSLGRNTFWAVQSRLRLRRLFTGDAWAGTERIFYGVGSDFAVDDANIDIESGQAPTRCVAEFRTNGFEGGKLITCRLADVVTGGLKPGIPLVILGQADRPDFPARFDLSRLVLIGDDKEAVVRVEAPGWMGSVDLDYTQARTPAIRDLTGRAKVVRAGPLVPPQPVPATMPEAPGR